MNSTKRKPGRRRNRHLGNRKGPQPQNRKSVAKSPLKANTQPEERRPKNEPPPKPTKTLQFLRPGKGKNKNRRSGQRDRKPTPIDQNPLTHPGIDTPSSRKRESYAPTQTSGHGPTVHSFEQIRSNMSLFFRKKCLCAYGGDKRKKGLIFALV